MSNSIIPYYRQSTKKQERSGLGLEVQRSTVRKYVNDTGSQVIGTYIETESGTKSDRPQLARALDHARNAGATLVVAKLDRLARNLAFLDQIEKSRVAFTALDMPGAGKFQLQLMMAFAEEEARQIRPHSKGSRRAEEEWLSDGGGASELAKPNEGSRKAWSNSGSNRAPPTLECGIPLHPAGYGRLAGPGEVVATRDR